MYFYKPKLIHIMKQRKSIFYLMILLLSVGFCCTACSEDEEAPLEDIIAGTWKVVAYSPTSADTLIEGAGLFKEFYFGTDKHAKITSISGPMTCDWACEGNTVTLTQSNQTIELEFVSHSSNEAVCHLDTFGAKMYLKIQKQ